jgi:hypothetical protein
MRAYGALLVVGIFFSSSASAQFYRSPAPVPRPRAPVLTSSPSSPARNMEMQAIYADIHDGARYGQLSHKQAKELRREAGEIGVLEQRYPEGGLSDSEAAELRTRAAVLHAIVNAKRSGVVK